MLRYLLLLVFVSWGVAAENTPDTAALLVERREAEERYKRLAAIVDDLRDAYELQSKRLIALGEELHRLRDENSQLSRNSGNYVSREEIRKLSEKLQEVDNKREADKKLILEELQKLAKANLTAAVPEPKTPAPSTPVEKTPENGEFFTYTVQKGDTLMAIITAYNVELKKQGKAAVTLDAVKKANPNLNPNALRPGKEILIPVPSAR